jgi:hypothetical protein
LLGCAGIPGHERSRKLAARNIGFLYYRRREVDPHSLLCPPMHGVDDIDELRSSTRFPSELEVRQETCRGVHGHRQDARNRER